MQFTRVRYQQGCLVRERRRSGAVWVFRWREETPRGIVRRKLVIGKVKQYPTKAAAQKGIEAFRININRETWVPSTVEQLIIHYMEKELPTKTPYTVEVYKGYLKTWILPAWGKFGINDVRTVRVKEWLDSLALANGTKAKIRNLMHALWKHAMKYEWTGKNPITLVNQSAKRRRAPEILSVEEINALLTELREPFYTMVFVAVATGLRVSELLGLKWGDFDFERREIILSRGVVRQHIGLMKTEASRKPLPLDSAIAEVLTGWRHRSSFNQADDWVFASPEMNGTQPYWPTSAMERHIRPAASRAGITKRIGWHVFRHSYATLLKYHGADVKVVQELLRHANSRTTLDVYTQAVTPAKREAQSKIVQMFRATSVHHLDPSGPTLLREMTASG
jgi:integrase